MLFQKKSIKIQEYTSLSARKDNARLVQQNPNRTKTNLEFTVLKLSIAMARTILSKNPPFNRVIYQSISSLMNIYTIISRRRELTLVNNVKDIVRDFSYSKRIGELGEGLSFLFAQEILNKKLVIDFEGYISRQGSSSSTTAKTPDFVVQISPGAPSITK